MAENKIPEGQWEVEITDTEIQDFGQSLADWGRLEELSPEKLCVVLRVVSDQMATDLGIQFSDIMETEELH